MPAIVERDLRTWHHRDLHVGYPVADPAHLAVVHREKTGGDVLGVADAGAEAPGSAQPVTAVDDDALSVRKVLATQRHLIAVGGEHLVESVVRQVGSGRERRRHVGDADPAERAVLPCHFDPGLDHLGKRRLDTSSRGGVERRHQAGAPHLVDDGGGQRAALLGRGRLGCHQLTHAARQRDNPAGLGHVRNRPANPRSGRSALVSRPGGAATTDLIALRAGNPVTVMPIEAKLSGLDRSTPGLGKIMCLL